MTVCPASDARPTILVVCPTEIDRRELSTPSISSRYDVHFHDYNDNDFKRMAYAPDSEADGFHPLEMAEDLDRLFEHIRPDGVISTLDYPGAIWSAVIATKYRLMGSRVTGVLTHQHKYHSRKLQLQSVPEATPAFALVSEEVADRVGYPCFVKPTKSFLSYGSQRVTDAKALEEAVEKARLPKAFLEQFEWFLEAFSPQSETDEGVLVESLMRGVQCTLDGYMDRGCVTVLGVVDSIMYPGTFSFKRFEYPSRLDAETQDRMADIATRVMETTDFHHGFFNIEFMFDPTTGEIGIIEVNPRMAYQFADLYEKVDGINLYDILLDLSLGKSPQIAFRKGLHSQAVICVYRAAEDGWVETIPSDTDISAFRKRAPDMRYQCFVKPGQWLSDVLQDGQTYRYATVSVGTALDEDLEALHDALALHIPFVVTCDVRGRHGRRECA
jgi:hypothetical protein